MRILIIISFFLSLLSAEDKPLPFSAQKALDSHNRDVEKLQAAFDKDKAKLVDSLIKALEKEMDSVTKKGDLEGALSIKSKITELRPPVAETGIPVQAQKTNFIGEWKIVSTKNNNTIISIKEQGDATWGSRLSGKWAIEKDTLTIQWANGIQYQIKTGGMHFTELNPSGNVLSDGKLEKWE